MSKPKDKVKPGPEAERLKLEGDWKQRLGQAVKKPRPEGGWPKPTPPEKKRPKSG